MVDLSTAASVAEILGGVALVVGLPTAVIAWRRQRAERDERAALEIVRAGQSREFMHALDVLYQSPPVTEAALAANPELRTAVDEMWAVYETLGFLVYKRMVPLTMFDEFAGGGVRLLWDRCEGWITERRKQPGAEHAFEWIQWLAEQVGSSGAKRPANDAYRDWRP